MSETLAADDINAAVDAAVGALLLDRDVTELSALEGGFLEVLRRGRRERLDAVLEGPLFSLLREAGAENDVVRFRLRGGQRLVAGPLVDGRTALRIEKSAPLDATLEALAQEGILPPGIGGELVAAVLEGAGVLVLGPSRSARQRTVAAVVRALQGRVAWFGLSDALGALVPVPLPRGASAVDRARAALALGADAVCGLELDGLDLQALARCSLGVPIVASATASSMDSLTASIDVDIDAIAGQAAVIGHGPDGRPRLLEVHGPTRDTGPAPVSPATAVSRGLSSPSSPEATRGTVVGAAARVPPNAASMSAVMAPAEVSGLRARPSATGAAATLPPGAVEDEPLPPLESLPADWASDAADDDPGWELGEGGAGAAATPPAPGSFDAALQAASKSRPPSFAPRPPPPHPQASALQRTGVGGGAAAAAAGPPTGGGDPFGGLTFEPPPGGGPSPDDEVEEGDE